MKTNNEEGKIAAEKDEEARSQGSRGARDSGVGGPYGHQTLPEDAATITNIGLTL